MKIIIVTQDEPFYLAKNIDYLLKSLPKNVSIDGFCLTNPSPFGKKENFLKKSLKTINIFGLRFFLYYSFQYLEKIFDKTKNVKYILKKYKIKNINLKGSINSKDSIEKISSYNPDLIISILGNEIFKKEIINLPKMGLLNLHSSLLPKYRGLMPSFWVLKNKEKVTGVSLFFVDEGIDSGPILLQKKIPIKNYSQKDLICLTKRIGMELIISALEILLKNEKVKCIENKEEDMTYYSFPKKIDVKRFLKGGNKFF